MMKRLAVAAAFAAVVGLGAAARAETEAEADLSAQPSWPAVTAQSAADGAFLPASIAPTVSSRGGLAVGFGGYDGARGVGVMEALAEARVWGPLALRGGAVYSDTKNRLRPSVGARLQLLRQERAGIDGAVGVFYRPEGLTEAEGEIETVISVGRRIGATAIIGNLAYGQDPEGNERDGEVRAAVLRQFGGRFFAGLDGRARFDLGSQTARLVASNEPTFDLMAGPTASVLVGPVVLSAYGGLSTLKRAGSGATATGGMALAGVGSAF